MLNLVVVIQAAEQRTTMSQGQHYKEVDLSIIVPVYNEEGNVELLYNEIVDSLSGYDRSYELVFIDDGSTDRSFEKLNQIQLSDDHILLVQFCHLAISY